jgi:hypothetical protein
MPTEEEQGHESKLNQVRQMANTAKNAAAVAATGSPTAAIALAKDAFSVRKKLAKHQNILLAAFVFDIFGLIPVLGDLSDLAFGLLLWLYFGSQKKSATSDLLGIALPEVLGSALRLLLFFLPVNVATTLIRIGTSPD